MARDRNLPSGERPPRGRPGVLQTLRGFADEIGTLAGRGFPRFVYESLPDVPKGELPVFLLHEIVPEEFDRRLRYLADNGYRTLTCDEYVAAITGQWQAPARSVLLTADDGLASVWQRGHPLLAKYDMRIALFVIPGHTADLPTPRPFLADGEEPRTPPSGAGQLMSWAEIGAMHRAGTADVQSHSLRHARRFASPRIVDFFIPDGERLARRGWHNLVVPEDTPIPLTEAALQTLAGMPIYESASPFAGRPRYHDDPALRARCMAVVASGGGMAASARGRWRARLTAEVRRYGPPQGWLDDAEALMGEMCAELRESRRLIEQRVPGASVRHFALPYGEGTDRLLPLIRETGMASTFWTRRHNQPCNSVGGDPYRLVRLKSDLIECLPGRKRRSLGPILADRVGRRLRGIPVR